MRRKAFSSADVVYYMSNGARDRPIEDRWLLSWIAEFAFIVADEDVYEPERGRMIVFGGSVP
jgi:hypothetical protein